MIYMPDSPPDTWFKQRERKRHMKLLAASYCIYGVMFLLFYAIMRQL